LKPDNVVEFPSPEPDLAEEARIAAAIVYGIRAGSDGAETDLVQRYSRGLRYLLLRRIGDRERAEDLLHDTLVIALEKLRTTDIDSPERLAGYLRGIAVRVAMNAIRKRQREPDNMDVDEVAAVADLEPRPFEQLSKEQCAAAVRQLLETMPVERDRELLFRFYVSDQDKEEICEALSLSSLHFNRVLFRAKARFRQILEESGMDGSPAEFPSR